MIFFPEPKKCPTCDKRLRKGHVCKEDPSKKTDFKCKFCDAYLDNEVSLGFHLWKHTKDPKYIVTTPTKKCDKTPEKSSTKVSEPVTETAKTSIVADRVSESLTKGQTKEGSNGKAATQANGPSPPQAHAVNSFSQLTSQPLCLQTSGFAKEVKPLNMQVCNAAK